MSFKDIMSLLILFLDDLSIDVIVVLESSTIFILLSISPLCQLIVASYIFSCTNIKCIEKYICCMLLWDLLLFHYVILFFVSCYSVLQCVLFELSITTLASFFSPIYKEYHFPSFHLYLLCVFSSEASLFWVASSWFLVFIYFQTLHLLVRVFKLFTFKVFINKGFASR